MIHSTEVAVLGEDGREPCVLEVDRTVEQLEDEINWTRIRGLLLGAPTRESSNAGASAGEAQSTHDHGLAPAGSPR
jgi:muramoyltetrapeptide carboxypeptidase LdcA involved in peptidoglycan recycling